MTLDSRFESRVRFIQRRHHIPLGILVFIQKSGNSVWWWQTSFGGVVGYFYILSWLFLGAYVFQNLATGVMVSNYQAIRQQMDEQEARMREMEMQQNNADTLVNKVTLSSSFLGP